jgi:hypothetical protein
MDLLGEFVEPQLKKRKDIRFALFQLEESNLLTISVRIDYLIIEMYLLRTCTYCIHIYTTITLSFFTEACDERI